MSREKRPVIPFGGARNDTTGDFRLETPSKWLRLNKDSENGCGIREQRRMT
jgi:hypothetical protein